jgi:branched-chain amino acid transport system substrate-binding protein
VRILFESDQGTFGGGRDSASRLVDQGADIVVGHFASAAAAGAVDIYERMRIPVLLPAATANDLVSGRSVAFRLCGRDRRMAESIAADLARWHARAPVAIDGDESLHGTSLSAAARECLTIRGARFAPCAASAEVAVFSGMFGSSVRFARELFAGGFSGSLYLTDDAAHPQLAAEVGPESARKLFVYGFEAADAYPSARTVCAEYRARWKASAPTYFLETYAAMEIALALAVPDSRSRPTRVLAEKTWPTALGEIRFVEGEADAARYAVYGIEDTDLVPVRRLSGKVQVSP